MKKSFLIYYDYETHFEELTDTELGQLTRALLNYEKNGTIPVFEERTVKMAFSFIKRNLDADREKYAKVCQTRKEVAKKGGLAKAAKSKQKPPNAADMETDKETGTETVIDTDKDKDKTPYGDFVTLTPAQHKQLLDKHGKAKTDQLIDMLNNYKGASGKTYNSDYHAIVSWVLQKYNEQTRQNPQTPQNTAKPTKFHNYQGRKWDYEKLNKLESERIAKIAAT
ncbi:MAG: DUF6291 domain-containing protein [Defluviitaleaceae bacterium]|nr:DUF6291 domain-containing protein [Defluviitaleaceae bacterium]